MDEARRDALIQKLSGLPEDALVSLDEFFEGNTDLGSIGCNLMTHPGIEVFNDTLRAIAARPDVTDVLVKITEVDPGFGSWPFSDVVFVVGTIEQSELEGLVAVLEPDEIEAVDGLPVPALSGRAEPAFRLWWD